jgi:hypothetical protein
MKFLFTIWAICFSSILFAQDHYIFKGGSAVPLGDYGAKKIGSGGYANTGFNVAFENKTFITDNLSVGFYISYIENGLDTDQMVEDNFSDNPNILSANLTSGPYKALLVMVGPQYTLPVGQDGGFSLKGGIGAFTSFLGPLSLDAIVRDPMSGATTAVIEQFALQGNLSFSFYVGADFHYFLTDTFGLVAYFDYSLANPNFDLETLSGFKTQVSQQMQFINLGAGIVLKR